MTGTDGRRRDSAACRGTPSRGADAIALACHVNPDGDALGSMLGLLHVLRAAGRDVVASFPTPFVVAPHYRELPGLDLLTHPTSSRREPDVMVTFDCGSLGRLGDLEPAAKAARELVVLDHHVSNDRYGTINVIDPDAAASGVVVRRLVDELGLPLTDDAAVVPLRRARLRHRAVPVRDHHARGVRPRRASSSTFDVPVSRALAPAVRGAPLRVPQAARRGARPRAELDVEQRFVWTAVTQDDARRATASRSKRSRVSSTSCAAPPRPRSPACSRRSPTARSA